MSVEQLRPDEVEERFGIPVPTLRRWRYESRGPAYRKLGRNVYYPLRSLERFLEENTVLPRRVL